MNFEKIFKHARDESTQHMALISGISNKYEKASDRFRELADILFFTKDNVHYFSHAVPEEFHPLTVSDKVRDITYLTHATRLLEATIKVYETALQSEEFLM